MKHLLKALNVKLLLVAMLLFGITLPLLNSCKTSNKTTGSNSNTSKKTGSFSDTATMSNVDTGGGKQTDANKDKKP